MKNKVFRFLAGGLLLIGAIFATALPANAQRGEKAVGLKGGFSTYNSGGFSAIYFQYTFANHFRIAPEIGYMFRNDNKSGFEISADMHFPFKIAKGFGVYPLVGVTFNNWSYRGADDSVPRVGVDLGAGFDIYLTSNLKLSLQGKYSLMNDTSGGFFDMGIGYVF